MDPLTRERVLEAALALADAEGLEALSFRRLARSLDVTPMALYRYVRDKDDLLDGVGDLALGELELADDQAGSWQEGLRVAAHSYRRLLLRHPATVSLYMRRPVITPNSLRVMEALLGLLLRAGFSDEDAALVYAQASRFVLGLVAIEAGSQAPGPPSPEESASVARAVRVRLEALPTDRYPHVVEAAPFLTTRYDADANFEAGLGILIAGLEHRLAQRSGSTGAAAPRGG
jgi:AcrR family transcriptional regulator